MVLFALMWCGSSYGILELYAWFKQDAEDNNMKDGPDVQLHRKLVLDYVGAATRIQG